ncbi:Processing alpha glucosidase I [Rhodotorula sphaerocarpa]
MRAWLVLLGVLSLLPGLAASAEPVAESPLVTAANSSLLWGTYRPGLYFGLKPRIPDSLLTGLVWFGVHDWQSYTNARHECDQRDGLQYSYTEHDGRSAAKEVIKDPLNNVQLTIRWLKVAGSRGEDAKLCRVTVINYFGNEDVLGSFSLESELHEEGIEGDVLLRGNGRGLGQYSIKIANHETNQPNTGGPHASDFGERLDRTHFLGLAVPAGATWLAKNGIMNAMITRTKTVLESYDHADPPDPAVLFTLPNQINPNPNIYAFQKSYENHWGVDIFFDSADSPSGLDSSSLTAALEASSAAYQQRFSSLFPQIASSFSSGEQAFAQAITANLVGGIGYWQGQSIVDRDFSQEWDADNAGSAPARNPQLTEPRELLSATPSRSFFPRGFYWDEGFHLALIGAWDNDLALEIFRSWTNLADEDGWIAREQILGDEARNRVPEDFRAQYPSYANPPTLVMGLTGFIARLRQSGISFASSSTQDQLAFDSNDAVTSPAVLGSVYLSSPDLAASYLHTVYPTLKRHYDWFRRTQRGAIRQFGRRARSSTEAYRWRGRTADHVLTSGLDDYPRAVPPHLGELHLDLASWMGFFARTMRDVAEFLGEEEDYEEYEDQYEAIRVNIEDLHWSEEEQMYCDASVDEDDESYHVCHRGYVSLFPFVLSLLPADSPHLGATLELLRNPEHLWSSFGLRSLSKSHPLFGQGENYWRGPIWIQMNYLALGALHTKYAAEPGPYQVRAAEIYAELRKNVIDNVYKEWQRTGTVWEQYDSLSGKGQRRQA